MLYMNACVWDMTHWKSATPSLNNTKISTPHHVSAFGAKQASPDRWHPWWCQRRCARRPDRDRGAKHQWRMHVDIECSRLHAWSWVVEEYFGQTSIQTRSPAGVVPQYFKSCAASKSAPTRISEWTRTGVRLPTCQSICLMPCVLLAGAMLRMKSSHWMGLQKWQGLVTNSSLPCYTTCPRAFAP